MSNSSPSIARLGFFVCFVGLLAVGYYASTLRKELTSANQSIAALTAEVTSWKTKFGEAETNAKTNAAANQTCQQTTKDLRAQLEQAQVKTAAPKGGTFLKDRGRKSNRAH